MEKKLYKDILDITYLRDEYLPNLEAISIEGLKTNRYQRLFTVRNKACYYSTQKEWKSRLKTLENVFTNLFLCYADLGISEDSKKMIIDDELQQAETNGYEIDKNEVEIFAKLAEWHINNGLEAECPPEEVSW